MAAYKSENIRKMLLAADMRLADGIGVVYASRFLGSPLPGRVAGIDFCEALLERMAQKGLGVFLYGGRPGVGEAAAENLKNRYKGINILGTLPGYNMDNFAVIDEINRLKPDLVMVCLGFPAQENWIISNRERLDTKLLVGAGGAIDVFAGTLRRAPKIFISLGLEWLYRILRQPGRILRALQLPRFAFTVILKGRRKNA